MADDFMKELAAALNAGDEVPEGFERCEDCGGVHPITMFPKYHGPVIYGSDEKAEYPDERTEKNCNAADAALDGALMDRLGGLLASLAGAMQIPLEVIATNIQAVGAMLLTVEAVSKFRAANPNHTQEDLIRVIRQHATDAHVRGQFVNETLSRLMMSNPPDPMPKDLTK